MLRYVECENWLRERGDLGNKAFLRVSNWRNKIMIAKSLGDAEA